jgi:S-adenosylmethionine hydrolase
LTEYLFADKYGEIAQNINQKEINQIYMSYMQSLIDSYERLKSKFNQFHSRCLSEK